MSLLIVTAFFSAGSSALAADSYLSMIGGVGAGYYYEYPKDVQVQDFYRGGLTYRGFLEVKAESGLSIIGDVGYYSEGNRDPNAPYGTALTIVPVTVSLAYHFLPDSSISPYLGAGVGLYSIKESDPDITFLEATNFGKHIFAGLDIYFDRSTLLRAELRDTFIDPVSNTLYYQANFGGLTATVNLAIEWPLAGGRAAAPAPATPATVIYQPVPVAQNGISNNEYVGVTSHLDNIDSYYDQQSWDQTMYQPYNNPNVYVNVAPPPPPPRQIEEQQRQADKAKAEQQQKEQDYTNQKLQLRQEKKDQVNPGNK